MQKLEQSCEEIINMWWGSKSKSSKSSKTCTSKSAKSTGKSSGSKSGKSSYGGEYGQELRYGEPYTSKSSKSTKSKSLKYDECTCTNYVTSKSGGKSTGKSSGSKSSGSKSAKGSSNDCSCCVDPPVPDPNTLSPTTGK